MQGTTITDLRTVGVPVTDQDRALEFYMGTLGFEKRLDAPIGPGIRWIEVAPPGAATSIALVSAPAEGSVGVDTGIRFSTTDAGAEHQSMRARGVPVDDLLLWDDVPAMFTFRDQDGNSLYVVETP